MGTQVISQVLVIFILIALGFLCFKLKIATKESASFLSSFTMKVTLPCLMLSSFFRPFSRELLRDAGIVLAIAFAAYALAFLIAWGYPRMLRMKGPERGVHRYALIVPNSGFMGVPVVEGFLGSFYLFHVAVFNVPLTLLGFSIGLWLIAKEKGKTTTLSWKLFTNPPLLATVIGFFVFLFSVPFPAPLEQSIRLVGGTTTPLVMVIIGISIAQADMRRMLGRWQIYLTSFMRLFIFPALIALLCILVGVSGNLSILLVLLVAMPVASSTAVIAAVYDVAVEEASSVIVFSTLLSMITIPLTILALNHLFG